MRILITGAAGFIGSNLARRLLKSGHEVIGVDNFSYGFERNISELRKSDHFRFIDGDLDSNECISADRSDCIVHLASQKIPRYTNAYKTLLDNFTNLQKIVHKCLSDKSRLIFASTSDVYGKNEKLPFSETSDLVIGPTTVRRWAYAVSKINGEQYIISCNEEFGLEYTIARFFGSYGPNHHTSWWGGPQSVFIGKALLGQEIEIHGTGKQKRTFTYVEDTVDAIERMVTNSKAVNQIFNVGSEKNCEISIIELAGMIWRMVNGEQSIPRMTFIPYSDFGRYEDVMARIPDISKIKEMLGFYPSWGLEEGLRETIEWQRKLR